MDIDKKRDEWRHRVDNWIGKCKAFNRIAMRAGKTATGFVAIIDAAGAEAVPNNAAWHSD